MRTPWALSTIEALLFIGLVLVLAGARALGSQLSASGAGQFRPSLA
jgi:hypothetical protein